MTEPLRADAIKAMAALPEVLAGLLEEVEQLKARLAELEAQRRAPLEGWYTVEALVAQGRVKEGTLRRYLADREFNGLGQHVKEGRPLLIHGAGFERWWLERKR